MMFGQPCVVLSKILALDILDCRTMIGYKVRMVLKSWIVERPLLHIRIIAFYESKTVGTKFEEKNMCKINLPGTSVSEVQKFKKSSWSIYCPIIVMGVGSGNNNDNSSIKLVCWSVLWYCIVLAMWYCGIELSSLYCGGIIVALGCGGHQRLIIDGSGWDS